MPKAKQHCKTCDSELKTGRKRIGQCLPCEQERKKRAVERALKSQKARLENGLCRSCGSKRRKGDPTYCPKCRKKTQDRYQRVEEKEERYANVGRKRKYNKEVKT